MLDLIGILLIVIRSELNDQVANVALADIRDGHDISKDRGTRHNGRGIAERCRVPELHAPQHRIDLCGCLLHGGMFRTRYLGARHI